MAGVCRNAVPLFSQGNRDLANDMLIKVGGVVKIRQCPRKGRIGRLRQPEIPAPEQPVAA